MRFSKFLALGLCVSAFAGFTACNDDDVTIVDGLQPTLDTSATQAWIEGGKDLVVKGTLTDNDGIATIDIVCHELMVNKTIDLIAINDGVAPTSYDLNYKIQTSKNILDRDSYLIEVTVTDVAGQKTSQQITARLDGDQTAPVFTASPSGNVTVVVTEGEAASFELSFTVTDNNLIDYVTIDLFDNYEGANVPGFPKTISVGKSFYAYSETINFNDDTERKIDCTIEAFDIPVSENAHSTKVTALYNLSQVLPPDQPLWLCDVNSTAELSQDVFGIPMLIENVGENLYEARYFNEKAGTQIFFLGQKTDFGPTCIGISKEDPNAIDTKLDKVERFTLDQAGVYYKIMLNTLEKTYDISTYTIAEAISPIMHMHYGEDDMNTWWETNNMDEIWWQRFVIGPAGDPGSVEGNEMVQDANNPNIFYRENWDLPAGNLNFAIQAWHSHGWWNFESWRVTTEKSFPEALSDKPSQYEPERFIYYGNYHPTTPHYESNDDYFEYKYGNSAYFSYMYPDADPFDVSKWGDESYRKNFVPDNWVNVEVKNAGRYKLIFDAHLERAKLVPQD